MVRTIDYFVEVSKGVKIEFGRSFFRYFHLESPFCIIESPLHSKLRKFHSKVLKFIKENFPESHLKKMKPTIEEIIHEEEDKEMRLKIIKRDTGYVIDYRTEGLYNIEVILNSDSEEKIYNFARWLKSNFK